MPFCGQIQPFMAVFGASFGAFSLFQPLTTPLTIVRPLCAPFGALSLVLFLFGAVDPAPNTIAPFRYSLRIASYSARSAPIGALPRAKHVRGPSAPLVRAPSPPCGRPRGTFRRNVRLF